MIPTSKIRKRPKTNDGALLKECFKEGCHKPSALGQIYCSRECSPFGLYGLSQQERRMLETQRTTALGLKRPTRERYRYK